MKREPTDQRGKAPQSGSRHLGNRRPELAGLIISAVAHILLIVLYPFFSATYLTGPPVPFQPAVQEPRGIQVVEIVELSSAEAGEPDDPTEIEDPGDPDVTVDTPVLEEDTRVRFPGPYLRAHERLRLSEGDPRLWAPIDPSLFEPSPEQLLELRILAAIESVNDSAFAEAERMRQTMDWTHTDEDGNKWGISPGKIHLGDIEIPMPFGFGPPPDYNGDQAEWAFRMTDIDRAAGSLAARRSWRERMEVMLKRREERKAEEEAERQKSVPVVKPDTTSSGPRRR